MTDTVILKKTTVAAMEQAIMEAPITLERVIKSKNNEINRLRDRIRAAVSEGDFRLTAPCIFCGYSGPGFYQPEQHKCAELIND